MKLMVYKILFLTMSRLFEPFDLNPLTCLPSSSHHRHHYPNDGVTARGASSCRKPAQVGRPVASWVGYALGRRPAYGPYEEKDLKDLEYAPSKPVSKRTPPQP